MTSNIPPQMRMPRPHQIKLSIPRRLVNAFLSILWDDLSENIGPVGCLHYYFPTDNPEIYRYEANWSVDSLPFDAQMNFINHTARGIIQLDVSAISRDTMKEDVESIEKIRYVALEAEKKAKLPRDKAPTRLARVHITSALPINGRYELLDSVVFPLTGTEEESEKQAYPSALEFFVFSNSSQEAFAESHSKARDIVAAITLLTQNLFLANFANTQLFSLEEIGNRAQDLENMPLGAFIPDDGLIVDQIQPDENGVLHIVDDQAITKDIVEPRDCIINGTIALPQRIQQALDFILEEASLAQASRRFQEGVVFQQEMIYEAGRRSLGDMLTPYQLIAFVASIEALLDTSPVNIEHICPACGNTIIIKDRQIAKSFQRFVSTYSDNNAFIEDVFREVYNDRSKFVHTGKDLYNPTAIRPNRPLILDGKNFISYKPHYHYNLPDYVGSLLRRFIYRTMG